LARIAEHAVTRSVRDSAAQLDATAGPELGDPYCAPPLARPFAQEVGADSRRKWAPIRASSASLLRRLRRQALLFTPIAWPL